MTNIIQGLINCVNALCGRVDALENGGQGCSCTLVTEEECVGVSTAWGIVRADGSAFVANGFTSSRIAQGRYQIQFNPPKGTYNVQLTPVEDINNRDGRDVQIVEGSENPNGFQYMVTTGDNGGAADAFVDEQIHINVTEEMCLITAVSLEDGGDNGGGGLQPCSKINLIQYQALPFSWNIQFQNTTADDCPYEVVICGQSYDSSDVSNYQANGGTVTITDRSDGCLVISGTLGAFGQVQATQPNGFGGQAVTAGTAEVFC